MGVPACLSTNGVALHGFVPAHRILDRTCQDVVDAWPTIHRWGAFIEGKQGLASGVLLGTFKNVVLCPVRQDGVL